jgi:OOP family OmpA-OmpF porin
LDGAAPSSLRAWEVSFAFDSATPDAAPDPAAWRSCAGRVEVTGHADPTGPAAYNLRLALRRAEAVRDALIAGGVAAARVEVRSAGERQPAVAGDSLAARRASRRVVIRCVP